MGCCVDRRDDDLIFDAYLSTEYKLCLQELKIHSFESILRGTEGDQNPRWLSLDKLGSLFQQYEFGRLLLASQANELRVLLSHSIFWQDREDPDRLHVFALGLLYCQGTNREKVDALFRTFDSNRSNNLYFASLKKIIYDLVFISSVLVPALTLQKSYSEVEQELTDQVQEMVIEISRQLFGNDMQISKEAMKFKLDTDLKYLFSSRQLRFRVKKKRVLTRAKTADEERGSLQVSNTL